MMHFVTNSKKYFVMFLFTILVACGGSSKNTPKSDDGADSDEAPALVVPETYNFKNSTYVADSDSVSYTGQVARQLLITGMVDYMEAMTESGADEATFAADLDFYMIKTFDMKIIYIIIL